MANVIRRKIKIVRMKGILTVLVVVVLVGFGWYFYQGSGVASVDTGDTGATTKESDDSVVGDESDVILGEAPEAGDSMKGETGSSDADADAKTFNVTGKNFEFSQSEIRVKKGSTVTINFESTSGHHDWVVDEFDAATQQVDPGTKTSVTFVADKVGTFEYYCSVGTHRALGMVGNLIVE
jgi:plastocyanin